MTPTHQRQWLRVRALRVERARSAVAAAAQQVVAARQVVDERRQRIDGWRSDIETLARTWLLERPACLPRWAVQVARHRDHLAERLERDEYALIDDEHALEEAQDLLQQRRAALAQAMAREEAVTTLLDRQRKQAAGRQERLAEYEIEERRIGALEGATR
jgi:hypothetical protein